MAVSKPGTVNTVSPAQNALFGAMQSSTPSVATAAPKSSINIATQPAAQTFNSSFNTDPLAQGTIKTGAQIQSGVSDLGTPIPKTGVATNINPNIGSGAIPSADVAGNQAKAASMGITIPGVGEGTSAPVNPAGPVIPQPTNPQVPQNPAPDNTSSGYANQAAQSALQNSDIAGQAKSISDKYAPLFEKLSPQARALAGYETTGFVPIAGGSSKAALDALQAQQGLLTSGENAELAGIQPQLTAQSQQTQGLINAGQLMTPSNQYAAFPYSSQIVGPNGPQSSSGGGSLNDAVSNVTNLLQNNKIGFSDAQSQLSCYGQAGMNALSDWASKNGFNIAQSNTLAAQQGAITPNLNYANAALDNLNEAMSNLQVWGQGSNIPIIGGLANYFSTQTGIGKQQTSTKAGAVGEAQQAIASVLASVKGGTPTDYGSQARALLPDNPTPADVQAAKANLQALGAQKQAIYGNPGGQQNNQNPQQNSSNSSSMWDY